jgi:hypothetical protein
MENKRNLKNDAKFSSKILEHINPLKIELIFLEK